MIMIWTRTLTYPHGQAVILQLRIYQLLADTTSCIFASY
jgi:hypothetical protein